MNQIARIEEKIDKSLTATMQMDGAGITFRNASEVMEWAKMMAVSGSAVPKHLRGEPGACLGIIDDAIRFGFSTYALARKSYFVNDNLAYEAQVLAAIIIARAPIRERPDIAYEGEGNGRKCTVTFRFVGGEDRTYTSPPVSQIDPKRSPLWKSDTDQQLAYYSLRAASRRHCPDVLLGVYDVEEIAAAHARDVTPARPEFIQRLQGKTQSEGFSEAHVERETNGKPTGPEAAASPAPEAVVSVEASASPADAGATEAQNPSPQPTPVMQSAAEAAERVEGWSAAKRDAAERIINTGTEIAGAEARDSPTSGAEARAAGDAQGSDGGSPSPTIWQQYADWFFDEKIKTVSDVRKADTAWWKSHAWPDDDGLKDKHRRIRKIHERRAAGDIDDVAANAELREAVQS